MLETYHPSYDQYPQQTLWCLIETIPVCLSIIIMTDRDSQPFIKNNHPSPHSHSHPDYLPHLDGLRALALTGAFSSIFAFLSSKVVSQVVDVFLSLSGFLITPNILRQLSENRFTLISFYKRRFFRLYPASVVTVLFTLCLGFLSFPPGLFYTVGESAIPALLFYANVVFNFQAGYVDSTAVTIPILHFCSLSLEEQYYFVWAGTPSRNDQSLHKTIFCHCWSANGHDNCFFHMCCASRFTSSLYLFLSITIGHMAICSWGTHSCSH